MKGILTSFIIVCFSFAHAQVKIVSGIVQDQQTHEPLSRVSVTIRSASGTAGVISNEEGKFSIKCLPASDSLKFSMIGYRSKILAIAEVNDKSFITVMLESDPVILSEVVIRPMGVMEIITRAAKKIPSSIPSQDFEGKAFYREIIQDKQQYYSVAEAIFDMQFFVQKNAVKLKLEKGRTKEDVAYTRLFEDFHPGGGPEDAVHQSLALQIPDFLKESKFKNYAYLKDSTITRDGHIIYVVSFDQNPGVHEALEKGKLYIDADDFSLVRFDAQNSPVGTPYIKSLRGTDKIFADILNIEFKNKGWARTASFIKIGEKLFLDYAKMIYAIDYKQPKKALDLSLAISTEFVVTDFQHAILKEINKGDEWKRKNLVANLPSDFDSAFWGSANILSPTMEIKNIIDSLSRKNNDLPLIQNKGGWQYLNKEFFSTYAIDDSLVIIPLAKSSWEDEKTGGMIFKQIDGDFTAETKISIRKRSNKEMEPDNGFQQCGFIIRDPSGKNENNIIFSLGTGGNDKPKYFLKRTTEGKTKGVTEKINNLTGWLKMERRGKSITIYRKEDENSEWIKVTGELVGWLKDSVQCGFSIMNRFPGDGPKQHPDMKVELSHIKISGGNGNLK